MRDWAESLLNERRLREHGFFDVAAVREKLRQYLAGSDALEQIVWTILMFQAWHGDLKHDLPQQVETDTNAAACH